MGARGCGWPKRCAPDVITMDLFMPEMDGIQATREIMIEAPTRIVMISGHLDLHEVKGSMQALDAGALTVLPKPPGPDHPLFNKAKEDLLKTIKAMSSVKVVRHWRQRPLTPGQDAAARKPGATARIQVVAIASSTGGPTALQQILGGLPTDYAAPILIVQHMPVGFTPGLAEWLNDSTPLSVVIAQDDEPLKPGKVYLAPESRHLGVTPAGDRAVLASGPAIGGFQPSATFLFESVARAFGAAAMGIILTGMGRDGVDGLRRLRAAGGRIIAQDEATSVVYGMPREAVIAGLADAVLPIEEIILELLEPQQSEHAAL